jgi:iron complex outermembrane receptor protein
MPRNNPDLDGYSGYVQAGVAELDTTELEGAINIPLGSTAAVRLAGKYNDRGEGHVTNVLNGSEIGGEKRDGVQSETALATIRPPVPSFQIRAK